MQWNSISEHVALKCVESLPDFMSTQLCVLSNGMCVESVASHVILQERSKRSGRYHYCVIFPDRTLCHLMVSFANSLKYFLDNITSASHTHANRYASVTDQSTNGQKQRETPESLPIHLLVEGTSTKDRCLAFQHSGVLLCTSRMFCADLLHKRISAALVAAVIVCLPLSEFPAGESRLASTAFAIEFLLREDRSLEIFTNPSRRTAEQWVSQKPRILILSDRPTTLRYLVSRHVVGQEQFLQLMHVSDIQLFPSFRLSVMQHFEQLSKKKPLAVDRIVLNVPTSTRILDALFRKVLHEVLSELCKLQKRVREGSAVPHECVPNGNFQQSESTSLLPDDDLRSFQPLVRLRLDPTSPTAAASAREEHLMYEASHGPKHFNRGNKAAREHQARSMVDYLNTGPWRSRTDASQIYFGGISKEVCLDTQCTDLDADLQIALESNAPDWVFRSLVESLLDLRHLRRKLWTCSRHDFFFELLSRLNPRRRGNLGYHQRFRGLSASVPTASWTMSSSFNDVVTVATERIGRVVISAPGASTNFQPTNTIHASHSIDIDEDSPVTESDDVVIVEPQPSAAPLPTEASVMLLVPNTEDLDTELEVAHRMTLSWVQACIRKRKQVKDGVRQTNEPVAALLVVVFGHPEVARFVERLMYTQEDFLKLQLTNFLCRYRAFFGVALEQDRTEPLTNVQPFSSLSTRSLVETAVPSQVLEDPYNQENLSKSEEESGSEHTEEEVECKSVSDGEESPLGVLHSALLTQAETQVLRKAVPSSHDPHCTAEQGASAIKKGSGEADRVHFRLEAARFGMVVLSPISQDSQIADAGATPRVLVAEGNNLPAAELLALLRGESNVFSNSHLLSTNLRISTSSVNRAEKNNASTPDDLTSNIRIMVNRILLVQNHIEFLRKLETVQDELEAELLCRLKVQLVATVASEEQSKGVIEREKLAFKALAHSKATFTGIMLANRDSVRETESILERGNLPVSFGRASASRRLQSLLQKEHPQTQSSKQSAASKEPLVLFDEREFRSMLPYFLYKQNLHIVPLTLATADYVLSRQYAVERKSVRDYTQSLQSGRIYHQLAALCRRYERPLLLIEFHRHEPFRIFFSSIYRSRSTEPAHMRTLYARTARLLMTYPQLNVLWSRNATHSASMFARLKKTVAEENIDPSDASLTTAGGLGTNDEDEVYQSKELSVYAIRILSKLPGVTLANRNQLMQVCGCLAGLSTISQATLISTIGETLGLKLYNFLHTPFSDTVYEQTAEREQSGIQRFC